MSVSVAYHARAMLVLRDSSVNSWSPTVKVEECQPLGRSCTNYTMVVKLVIPVSEPEEGEQGHASDVCDNCCLPPGLRCRN